MLTHREHLNMGAFMGSNKMYMLQQVLRAMIHPSKMPLILPFYVKTGNITSVFLKAVFHKFYSAHS